MPRGQFHEMESLDSTLHRWLSVVFTLAVIANIVVAMGDDPPEWVAFAAIPPLMLLLFTGLYLFVLPYVGKNKNKSKE